MLNEINRASLFLLKLMRSRDRLSREMTISLRDALVAVMVTRYHNHWFPLSPHRGSAYRCIRVNQHSDPVITAVAHITGLSAKLIRSWLPLEFTMWVDPNEVSYRIGENGSVMAVFVPDIEDIQGFIPDPIPKLETSLDVLDRCKKLIDAQSLAAQFLMVAQSSSA
ncbi:protein BTG2-like [Nilaparvata lugens]|uniref:protein BTG2-like n=1 Tax=Nilaparvata lugens TaxID=108931 RepID=UPI00193E0344|nr:protein BTG2-like [Nilaparvata lugens]XP_039299062.1 protein BTG2-like [Nilaparvata lugens]XP_039299063.1 protein BTG2-like [Nilaparvata lugens]XP_039299064.1 protein BTG2-like [Nilaparvata lugens]